jgi:endonuclease/exonuclease/phosphatase (EEP) superfamily protein YafD
MATASMVVAWLLIRFLGDRVWWALPFLFGPRWVAAILFVAALPAILLAPRTAVRPVLIMAFVYVFGIIDFRLGLGRLLPSGAHTIRVMELNASAASGTTPVRMAILAEIGRIHPDIVVIAECSDSLQAVLASDKRWHVRAGGYRLCMASRFDILEWEQRDPSEFWGEGGSGAMAKATVITPSGAIRIGVLHLETPRNALEEYFDLSEIPRLGEITRKNTRQREKESRIAREWMFTGRQLPTLVVGDFNSPVESAIYRRHWGDLRNAFSRAGIGLGGTRRMRQWTVRIDHILASQEFSITWSAIGNPVGSDHLPIAADLSLSTPQRTNAAR